MHCSPPFLRIGRKFHRSLFRRLPQALFALLVASALAYGTNLSRPFQEPLQSSGEITKASMIGLEVTANTRRVEAGRIEGVSSRLFSWGFTVLNLSTHVGEGLRFEFKDPSTGNRVPVVARWGDEGPGFEPFSQFIHLYPLLFRRSDRELLAVYLGSSAALGIAAFEFSSTDTTTALRQAMADNESGFSFYSDLGAYMGVEWYPFSIVALDLKFGLNRISVLSTPSPSNDHGVLEPINRGFSPIVSVSVRLGTTKCFNCRRMASLGYMTTARERREDAYWIRLERADSTGSCSDLESIAREQDASPVVRKKSIARIASIPGDSCTSSLVRLAGR